MPFETLHLELTQPIAVVTLNRPAVLNALNRQMLNELEEAFRQLAAEDSIRAILITGSGDKAFAAGADISELAGVSGIDGERLATRGHAVFNQIEHCGKPVIACINGFALGGGCELALACTFRIASESARLGQPELKLGLVPGYGGTQRLPRLVGKGAALKLILTGEIVPAQEALRIGLVEEVVPADELLPRAKKLAASIAQMAPLAVRACLDVVHRGYDLPLDQALAIEAAGFRFCCSSEDKVEGTTAFLEKRAPHWKGQ
jgi:enoyl-CoA hydratase